jgi:hypothetical protein
MATPLTATPIPAYTAIPDVPADLTSALNNLEKFAVTRWATTTARDATVTAPVEGMLAYTNDTDTLWKFNGTSWVDVLERTMPSVQVLQGVAQTLTTGVFAPVTFTTELSKTHTALHSNSSNTSRLIIGTIPGTWMVSGVVQFTTSATGSRRAILNFNGANIAPSYTAVTVGSGTFYSVVIQPQIVIATVSTDYVELSAYQDSGGNLATHIANGTASSLNAVRIGA